DTIAVGEPRATGYDSSPGAVYVFRRSASSPGAWNQVARRAASDSASSNEFGNSLALSGDTLVVGAPTVGKAYIYQQNAGNWGEIKWLIASDAPGDGAFGGPWRACDGWRTYYCAGE
ncbi:MAG: FG-GAP repeat protein, partial [Roseiflexaceae bacterium]